jgi:TRAP-type transport system small permease protein
VSQFPAKAPDMKVEPPRPLSKARGPGIVLLDVTIFTMMAVFVCKLAIEVGKAPGQTLSGLLPYLLSIAVILKLFHSAAPEQYRKVMRAVPEILRGINHSVHRFVLVIAIVCVAVMTLMVFYTVVLRYVFNTGFAWAEEVPCLLVTVFAFIACAMGVRDHMHVCVNLLYNRFRKNSKGRRAMEIFGDVMVLVCGIFLLYAGLDRVLNMMKFSGVMPMTGLPNWVQYATMPVAGFIICFDSILFLTGVLKADDLMYSEKEIDYADQVLHNSDLANKEGAL